MSLDIAMTRWVVEASGKGGGGWAVATPTGELSVPGPSCSRLA